LAKTTFFVAAHAYALDTTLVTANMGEFYLPDQGPEGRELAE
jgi:hypothetical protein